MCLVGLKCYKPIQCILKAEFYVPVQTQAGNSNGEPCFCEAACGLYLILSALDTILTSRNLYS